MATKKQVEYWKSMVGKPNPNKGKVGIFKPNSGSFKKGEHNSFSTEFKKGHVSPRKGKGFLGLVRVCGYCGKEFHSRRKVQLFCSCVCSNKAHIDSRTKPRPSMQRENNHNWNGGSSRGYKTGYYSKEYKDWRRDVFLRDEFTCRQCGAMHVYITAHHIKSFAYYPDLRFDLDNGMTLCEECHKKTDNYKGRAKKRVVRP